MTAFILRFQEAFLDSEDDSASQVSAGTKSTTLVRAEASDADDSANLTVVPRQSMAGTQSTTRVATEGSDPDPHSRGLQVIPSVCC